MFFARRTSTQDMAEISCNDLYTDKKVLLRHDGGLQLLLRLLKQRAQHEAAPAATRPPCAGVSPEANRRRGVQVGIGSLEFRPPPCHPAFCGWPSCAPRLRSCFVSLWRGAASDFSGGIECHGPWAMSCSCCLLAAGLSATPPSRTSCARSPTGCRNGEGRERKTKTTWFVNIIYAKCIQMRCSTWRPCAARPSRQALLPG